MLPDAKYVFDVAKQVKSLTGRTLDFQPGVPTHVPGICRVEVERAGGKLVGASAVAPKVVETVKPKDEVMAEVKAKPKEEEKPRVRVTPAAKRVYKAAPKPIVKRKR